MRMGLEILFVDYAFLASRLLVISRSVQPSLALFVQGGISNGEDIDFRIAFKPTATVMQTQATVNTEGENCELKGKGRHDPCVLPRAVPIVEAMAALVLVDHWMRHHAQTRAFDFPRAVQHKA